MTIPVVPDPTVTDATPSTDRRFDRWWTIAFAVLCVVVAAWLIVLARHASWWADDWQMIFDRLPWTVDSLLREYYGHPLVGVMLLWKLTFSTLGLDSYVPLMTYVVIAHVLVAAAVYTIVRRLVNAPVGFAAGALMLLLGSGGQAILVPAAMNHTASTALGLCALAIMLGRPDRRGRIVAAVVLVAALSFGASALFSAVAIAAVVLLTPGRRREVVVVVPMLAVYLVWRRLFSQDMLDAQLRGLRIDDIIEFMRVGIAHAIGSISGLGDQVGLIAAVVLVIAMLWHLVGRRPIAGAAVAGTIGLLAVYGITAISRAHAGATVADAALPSRYIYLAAPFLLIACAGWLSTRRSTAVSARTTVPVIAVVALGILVNKPLLEGWARFVTDQGQNARALITLVTAHAGSPALPLDERIPDNPDLFMADLPTPQRLLEVLRAYGSPTDPDPLAPDRPPIPDASLERVLIGLVRDGVALTQGGSPDSTGSAPWVSAATDAMAARTGGCLEVTATGPAPSLDLAVSEGRRLAFRGPEGAPISVALSGDGTFSASDRWEGTLAPAASLELSLPDLDRDRPWDLRLFLPTNGIVTVCLLTGS